VCEDLSGVAILMKSNTAVTYCGQGNYIETEKENGIKKRAGFYNLLFSFNVRNS